MDPKIYSVKPGQKIHDSRGFEVTFSGVLCGPMVFKVGDPAKDALLTEHEFQNLSADGWIIKEPKPTKAADKKER